MAQKVGGSNPLTHPIVKLPRHAGLGAFLIHHYHYLTAMPTLPKMTDLTPSSMDTPEILAAIFHPAKEIRNHTPPDCEEFPVEVVEGVSLGCRFFNSDRQAPVIVYFHGNGETVSDYDEIAPFFLEAGLNLFVASYRGYGWSSGEPSVSALFHDGAVVLERVVEFCRENDFSNELFVMGRSLGSAASIDLGYRFPELMTGIIIDSGFADSLPLAARLGYNVAASGLREEDCFNNLEKISEIEIPTLILHGAEDQLIPLQEASKLQAHCGARAKQLFVVPGADHNSLILRGGAVYFETIKRFTNAVTGKTPRRQSKRKPKS